MKATTRGISWAARIENDQQVVVTECHHEHLLQEEAQQCADALLEDREWEGNVEYF